MLIGIFGFVLMFALMFFLRVPIGLSMAIAGLVGLGILTDPRIAFSAIASQIFDNVASYDMAVVATFVFMGELAFATKIAEAAYETAHKWFGRMPGGLAIATIFACAAFAAVCGSSPATVATLASVALPEMKRYRYPNDVAAGSLAAGGTLGILIPPSIPFIILGLLTKQSIAALYIAGIVPGVILTLLLSLSAFLHMKCKVANSGTESLANHFYSLKYRLIAILKILDILLIFLVCIGGLLLGVFTATEAGAVGAFCVFISSLAKRTFSARRLLQALQETITVVGMIMLLYVGAMIFNYFLAACGLPQFISKTITSFSNSALAFMILATATWLFLGCVMDSAGMILLTVPIFYPVVETLGIDPIWFCVVAVMCMEAGLITPPVGLNAYIISGITGESLDVVFRGIWPYLGAVLMCLILVILFPGLVTSLPRLMQLYSS